MYFFTCEKMHTLSYHKHLYSYEVALINNFAAINYDELVDYHPLDIYSVGTGGIVRTYIRM